MKAKTLLEEFKKYKIRSYIEVPCSLLAPLITAIAKDEDCQLFNPVNESVAMGLASGIYLATKKVPMVLIQNSGLCNTINAMTSLNQIYHIPLVLFISWRGEPGTADAPEHSIIGAKLKALLDVLDIPYEVVSEENFRKEIREIVATAEKTKKPTALILRGEFFDKEVPVEALRQEPSLTRGKVIDIIVDMAGPKSHMLATNGYISREVFYNLNEKEIESKNPPFYMLGSMGHLLPIALGIATRRSGKRKIVAIDGDGGCMMHLGAMASVGRHKPNDLIHIVLDDGVYASTGGQPTVSRNIDLCQIAKGCGYKHIYKIKSERRLRKIFPGVLSKNGPSFMQILINSAKEEERARVSNLYSCNEIQERFRVF